MDAQPTQDQGALALAAFPFATIQIRAILIADQCWFVAKDVFIALDLAWRGKESLNKIKAEWKGVRNFRTPSEAESGRGGGDQDLLIIAEPAVYKIAFRSDKPEAERFTDKIAEIVATIRKTGQYKVGAGATAMPVKLGEIGEWITRQHHQHAARYLCRSSQGVSVAVRAGIEARFGMPARDLPVSMLPELLDTLDHFGDDCYDCATLFL